MNLSVVTLAAGEGKRMCSALPKVLHQLAGKTLLEHVISTAQTLSPKQLLVVHGHQSEQVTNHLSALSVTWVEQQQQLGTGHAVQQALPQIPEDNLILVLFGDGPLISQQSLKNLLKATPEQGVGLLVCHVDNPHGLGRIVRDSKQNVQAIVEEKDATVEQKQINEIFSGIMAVSAKNLNHWLEQITNENAQQEYYLTDVVKLAIADDCEVVAVAAKNQMEIQGVNDKKQLAFVERCYQRQKADELMLAGVTLLDPNRFDLRGELTVGTDVTIDVNVIIEGNVSIGDNCTIGANTILRDVSIGNHVVIKENSVIEQSTLGNQCTIGPFARIRPGTKLDDLVHVGNFVELKKSHIGSGSKVNHLSYIGDAIVGQQVNIGAGTITCNYDGINKHQTQIADKSFIGSGTQLVAPVIIEEGAFIGAGSTITRTAIAGQLTMSRAKQCTVPGWQPPQKKDQ